MPKENTKSTHQSISAILTVLHDRRRRKVIYNAQRLPVSGPERVLLISIHCRKSLFLIFFFSGGDNCSHRENAEGQAMCMCRHHQDYLSTSYSDTHSHHQDYLSPSYSDTHSHHQDYLSPSYSDTHSHHQDYLSPSYSDTHSHHQDYLSPSYSDTHSHHEDYLSPSLFRHSQSSRRLPVPFLFRHSQSSRRLPVPFLFRHSQSSPRLPVPFLFRHSQSSPRLPPLPIQTLTVITKITRPLPIQALTGFFFFYSESVRVGVYCKPTVNLTRKGKRKSAGLIRRKEKYTWCYVCKVWICRIALRMRLPFCGVSQQQRGFLPTRFHAILLGKETGGECTAMQSVWDRKKWHGLLILPLTLFED